METLLSELVNIIVWHAFLDNDESSLPLLTVCQQWYRILTNINNMVVPCGSIGREEIYLAIRINRVPIHQTTIAQHFPHFGADSVLTRGKMKRYLDLFCVSYDKQTWQHMLLPTLSHFKDLGHDDYVDRLIGCRTPDAFFYLYHYLGQDYLGHDVNRNYNFVNILHQLILLVKQKRFVMEQLDQFINAWGSRSITGCDFGTFENQSIFFDLIELNYPADRLRFLVEMIDHNIGRCNCIASIKKFVIQKIIDGYIDCSKVATIDKDRVETIEKELTYWREIYGRLS